MRHQVLERLNQAIEVRAAPTAQARHHHNTAQPAHTSSAPNSAYTHARMSLCSRRRSSKAVLRRMKLRGKPVSPLRRSILLLPSLEAVFDPACVSRVFAPCRLSLTVKCCLKTPWSTS